MLKNKFALKSGFLIDGTGKDPVKDACVLIEGNRIVSVGETRELKIPMEYTILDVKGKTIMPGLMDLHAHFGAPTAGGLVSVWDRLPLITLFAAKQARDFIEAGFTTARNCGAEIGLDLDLGLKEAEQKKFIVAPRLYTAGVVQMSEYCEGLYTRCGQQADGQDEVRKAVRKAATAGVDFIKTFSSGGLWSRGGTFAINYTLEELTALVGEAHNLGKKVACHATGGPGIKLAIEAGVDSIEHGTFLDDELIQRMKEKHTFLVPTLAITINKTNQPSRSQAAKTSFKKALKAGIKIALGTDCYGYPYESEYLTAGENAKELEAMVTCGMTPMQALVSATKHGAELLGIDDCLGTVEKGKKADILVFDGNPLKDIKSLQIKEKISIVMKDGQIIVNNIG